MSSKGPIDLSRIPAPNVVEPLDFERIFAEMRNTLVELDPSLAGVLSLESEPLTKLVQMCAYRELITRQRVNESARAVMLPYAVGSDLDNLGALLRVKRLQTEPGDPSARPPVPPNYETDDDFRLRIQLALDGLSTAGPERSYVYHALSADGRVLDATADAPRFSVLKLTPEQAAVLPSNAIALHADYTAGLEAPRPGDVVITVLARDDDGTAPPDLIAAVNDALSSEEVRPMTDHVHVRGAEIIHYTVNAALFTYPGPDTDVVLATALAQLQRYTDENKRLGRSITRSGIYAALHVAGVQRVQITDPPTDINCTDAQAAHCNAFSVTHGGLAS